MTDMAAPRDFESDKQLVVGRHYRELDGLRALAALLVLYFHSSLIVDKPEDGLLLYYHKLTMVGWCGVDLFFVISGFLITGILMDTAKRKNCFRYFYIRRAVRIFPLYYMVLLVSFVGFSAYYPDYQVGSREVYYLLYLQNWFKLIGFNDVVYFNHFWSLAVEEQFYLVWPAVFVLAYRRSFAVPLCIILIVACVLLRAYLVSQGYYEISYTITITRIDGLVLGGLLAYVLRHNNNWVHFPSLFKLLMITSFVGVCLVAFVNGGLFGQDHYVLMYGLFLFALMFTGLIGWTVTADKNHWFMKFLRMNFMSEIGRVSYGIYVYHWFIMLIFVQFDFLDGNSYLFNHLFMLFVGGGLTYGLSWLSFKYFEKPMLKLKDVYADYNKETPKVR